MITNEYFCRLCLIHSTSRFISRTFSSSKWCFTQTVERCMAYEIALNCSHQSTWVSWSVEKCYNHNDLHTVTICCWIFFLYQVQVYLWGRKQKNLRSFTQKGIEVTRNWLKWINKKNSYWNLGNFFTFV